MKTSSCKAKGRRLQQALRDLLIEKYSGVLEQDDIKSTIMGESGADIQLSPAAQKLIPFNFETKNVEALNIWNALKQAELESKKRNTIPVVVFKRNRSETYVSLKLDDFLKLF